MARSRPNSEKVVAREWLDLAALTQYAAVSDRTLREWIWRQKNPLPAVKVGNKVLVNRLKFDAWLESHAIANDERSNITAIVDDVMRELGGQ